MTMTTTTTKPEINGNDFFQVFHFKQLPQTDSNLMCYVIYVYDNAGLGKMRPHIPLGCSRHFPHVNPKVFLERLSCCSWWCWCWWVEEMLLLVVGLYIFLRCIPPERFTLHFGPLVFVVLHIIFFCDVLGRDERMCP